MDPIGWSAMSATAAGIPIYLVALWVEFHGFHQVAIAAIGIVLDWQPLGFSMIIGPCDPSRVLRWDHLGFGVTGYIGLAGLAWHRIHNQITSRRIRMLDLCGWNIGYLAAMECLYSRLASPGPGRK